MLLFCVNVGGEGVEPLSRVHPVKVRVVGFMLLTHNEAPSNPMTTTARVSPTRVAAGASRVAPEARADHQLHVADAIV
jgi:hypothetical protein